MEMIITACITGGFTFAGVLVTNFFGNKKMMTELEKHQAITDEKISELTREVREHNNFAKRMPVVENEIHHIEEKINELHKND